MEICTTHWASLFKHLEMAILANSIDSLPKQIWALSSMDGKQSITAIFKMLIAWGVICSPAERGKREKDFFHFILCVCGCKERNNQRTHVIKCVSPSYCAPLWISTSPQHTFLLVVKLLFQMFALAASAQADKKGLRGKCNINQKQNTKRHQSSTTAPNYCISVSTCLCFHIWGGNKGRCA